MLRTGILFMVAVFAAGVPQTPVGPLVFVEQGALRGTYLASNSGRKFSAFEGIPYARPPVGKHRFKEATPHKPWRGVWPATKPGSGCLQYFNDGVRGDEDCLFLNVYSPMLPAGGSTPLLDVIVHFHGGCFMFGSGDKWGPKYLLDRDVIVVTVNYRLGPLGFLSTEDEVVPGNMGLKDQVLALRWVQRNIAVFGGNPASVTITGNSAGGVSVHYHYLSPMSHGLFQRGISMSGSSLLSWAIIEEGRAKAAKIAETLGCNTQTSRELVDCLRHRPARLIVEQVPNFQPWRGQPFTPFGPTVELAGITPFLNQQPIELILNGSIQDLPIIFGVTTEEGLYPVAAWIGKEEVLAEMQSQFTQILPYILDYNHTVEELQKQAIADSIRKFYFQNKPVSSNTANEVVKMVGDRMFGTETERAARLQAAVNTAPVYFYQFGYRGKGSFSEIVSGTKINYGSSHGDDAGFVFNTVYSNTETQQDMDMSKLLLDIWQSFGKTGKPVPGTGSTLTWEPVPTDYSELVYLHIANSNQLEMRRSPDIGNTEFWDSLPINEPQINVTIKNLETVPHEEL